MNVTFCSTTEAGRGVVATVGVGGKVGSGVGVSVGRTADRVAVATWEGWVGRKTIFSGGWKK
jgi:hypothetical protein